jgi:hypothetical protein
MPSQYPPVVAEQAKQRQNHRNHLIVMKVLVRLFIFISFAPFPSYLAAARAADLRYTSRLFGAFQTPNRIEDKRLLSLDVMSILVSNQLRGFTEVIEDRSFWANGGFAQPIFSIPAHSTLEAFVQRDCILTSLWLLVAFAYGDYTNEEISAKIVGYIILTFCMLRLLVDVSLSSISSLDLDFIRSFQDMWYTIVIVLAFRFVYYRRFH